MDAPSHRRQIYWKKERTDMHEMSYMLRLADLAVRRADEQHAKRITKITVDIGETSGVIPYYLQKYLPEAAQGTILEGAEMVTREVPVTAECADCGASYRPSRENHYSCPACGSIRAKITGGRDVVLTSIEVE